MENSDEALENAYFFAVANTILSTATVVSNVTLLFTVYRDPNRNQRLLHTPVTLLVVNLSICDLLAGISPGHASLYYNISILRGQTRQSVIGVRLLVNFFSILTNIVSSGIIAAMSFDRWLAVSSPLHYKARVTKRKMKVILASVWIYSLIFSSLSMMGVAVSLFVPQSSSCFSSYDCIACGVLENIPRASPTQ